MDFLREPSGEYRIKSLRGNVMTIDRIRDMLKLMGVKNRPPGSTKRSPEKFDYIKQFFNAMSINQGNNGDNHDGTTMDKAQAQARDETQARHDAHAWYEAGARASAHMLFSMWLKRHLLRLKKSRTPK
jgi:hypothetical protein